MFQDALLESSSALRRRNAWPLATAFTLQLIVATTLVLVPLISTGVITTSNHPTYVPIPPRYTPVEIHPTEVASANHNAAVALPDHAVVPILNHGSLLPIPSAIGSSGDTDQPPGPPTLNFGDGSPKGVDTPISGRPIPSPPVTHKPVPISHVTDAMLINKVMPEYPNIARLAGIQGDVKLHAIIAKDGTIQSLTVTSGPEMLRKAALDAVAQWRYRPYILNGEAVEVETLVTVSFHKE